MADVDETASHDRYTEASSRAAQRTPNPEALYAPRRVAVQSAQANGRAAMHR